MAKANKSQLMVLIMKEISLPIKEVASVVFVMPMETLSKDLLKMIDFKVKANIIIVI